MFCSSTTFIKTIKGRRRRGERGGQRLRRVEEKNSWICRESNGVYGKEKRKRKRKDKLIIFCDLYFEVPQFNLFVVKRFCWLIRKQLFGSYVFPFFSVCSAFNDFLFDLLDPKPIKERTQFSQPMVCDLPCCIFPPFCSVNPQEKLTNFSMKLMKTDKTLSVLFSF